MTTIVWFRQDLRLSDNPALSWAAERGEVIPVYILDETGNAPYGRMGGASRWWLHHSLKALSAALGGLHILKGDPEALLKDLADKSKADAISWNRCYEPHAIARDRKIKKTFQDLGLEAKSFNGNLLHEPWDFQTKAGGPYKVFTPFWRALRPAGMNMPLPRPKARIVTPRSGETLKGLALLPEKPDWAAGWDDIWTPGEKGARDRLDAFLENGLAGYGDGRNRPDLEKVSRLSPHLHFGEISPRQIVTATRLACERISSLAREGEKFLSEIGWREFSYHLLCHFPDLPEKNLRSDFDAYPWRESADDLKAWQRGMTGYPLVDAGMRQLWQTGWMHNRVRMVTASFLIKHLRIDWRQGEAWF
ncbi:MAG: deoxyribodipyrimidine photo-lyase, partial [Flavobacteriaceae bacterium]